MAGTKLNWREHERGRSSHLDSYGKFWFGILVPPKIYFLKLHSMNQIKHIISKISPAGYQFALSAEKVWVINMRPMRLIISC